MTSFAETQVQYYDGQLNVYPLPENMMAEGFQPKLSGKRGQPLAANWLNWLFRELFRKVNRDRLSDGNGVAVIKPTETNCFVTVHAMVKADNTKWISAIGYKTGTAAPVMHVIGSGTLGLGALTATDVPITGATADTVAVRVTVTDAQ